MSTRERFGAWSKTAAVPASYAGEVDFPGALSRIIEIERGRAWQACEAEARREVALNEKALKQAAWELTEAEQERDAAQREVEATHALNKQLGEASNELLAENKRLREAAQAVVSDATTDPDKFGDVNVTAIFVNALAAALEGKP